MTVVKDKDWLKVRYMDLNVSYPTFRIMSEDCRSQKGF